MTTTRKEQEASKTGVQSMTLRIPRADYEALRTAAFATDQSINELVLAAIRIYLGDTTRRQQVQTAVENAISQYQVALDKLAEA
jgi:uncharacterized protein (DUF1778 family)